MNERRIFALRGATTVESDTAEQIKDATLSLFSKILIENGLDKTQIVSITASTTSDLTAAYPVSFIRESGFEDIPFFSCAEPAIVNSLKKSIRLLITVEKIGLTPKHIYLNGAKSLRPDLNIYNIALDGPSGAGKSTIAKILAERLNITYLDTGAMYRAAALYFHDEGIEFNDIERIKHSLNSIDISINYINGEQHIYLNSIDVSKRIREHIMSALASKISAIPEVRLKLVELQRNIAKKQSSVLDGRDIGTYVLPDAKYKFYLTADVEIRAQRRYLELREKEQDVALNKLIEDIKQRDYNDMNRSFAPLKQADDAIKIDCGNMTVDEVIAFIIDKISK